MKILKLKQICINLELNDDKILKAKNTKNQNKQI